MFFLFYYEDAPQPTIDMSDSRAVTVALSSAGETGSRAESLYTIIFLALIGVLSDKRSAHQHPSAGCGALSWELEANEENITAKCPSGREPGRKSLRTRRGVDRVSVPEFCDPSRVVVFGFQRLARACDPLSLLCYCNIPVLNKGHKFTTDTSRSPHHFGEKLCVNNSNGGE